MFNLTPWRSKEEKKGNGTALTRWEDHPFARMQDEFNALVNRFFGDGPAPFAGGWDSKSFWALDVDDAGKEVIVRAEAPGFEAEDFDVQVSGNLLTIKAERKKESDEKEGDYHYSERHYGQFQRSVTLPAGVEAENVAARYRNGVLEVRLPKTAAAQGKRIEVKA